EEEEEEEDEDFDELQPARTTQASRGMALSARKRRMKTSRVVDVSSASLLVRPSSCAPHSGVPQLTPKGPPEVPGRQYRHEYGENRGARRVMPWHAVCVAQLHLR